MEADPLLPPEPLAHKTDAELLYLTQHARRYPAPLVQAAVRELQRRELIPTELPGQVQPSPAPPTPPRTWLDEVKDLAHTLFWPSGSHVVTSLLLDVNLVVYLLMGLAGGSLLAPRSADLVAWGSNFSPLTLHGQPWRLLTCCFLHGGPAHLLLNAGTLVVLGLLAEPLFGRGRLLLGYLLSGVGGSLASLWWHMPGGVNSVGASGAIFGLYGLLLATAFVKNTPLSPQQRRPLFGLLLYLMLSSLLAGLEGSGNTDNAAHLGGLLTGVLVGLLMPHKVVEER
ncbi:rhomboid family intramembrane serine protease [Hymenobacter sp. GOD-10R]|uniref:rhomboid family intramembrane serine protease n=1 Tax=Hymenobacter sp. GOD-10R TaxID=3093922 RepID=UPI002D773BAD|nr:rhomboid family intramembrane serine protease [Hymenobacter sp. GOD-10R]WRQ29936.1 rhomboid family intramembrane serine protease [Hymenobacter sp. GOD-10R]